MIRRFSRVSPLLVLLVSCFGACAEQGEGERCDATANGDDDCASGLECVPAGSLRDRSSDRCCPPDGRSNDSRCDEGSPDTDDPDAGTVDGGDASAPDAAACRYTSECPEGQVCGPSGLCQAECREDRDCTAPLVCIDNRCVPDPADGEPADGEGGG